MSQEPSQEETPRLSVNVDHVATLRQARKAPYPDPLEAARIAEEAGAAGITVHLRADRRHIQDEDVEGLVATGSRINLEISTEDEMVTIAERLRPHQVSLVPERPDEVTTEGGLDLTTQAARVEAAAVRLTSAGIAVSIFLDPELRQVDALTDLAHRGREIGARLVGFEINTDAYTRAEGAGRERELARIREVAALGAERGLAVYAGHGLTTANVGPIAAVPAVEELNIGHWLVARSVMVGMGEAVREMLAAASQHRERA